MLFRSSAISLPCWSLSANCFASRIIRSILKGEERGPKRDAVLLNAAAALFVANRVRSMTEGWDLAAEIIDSGAAWRKFEQLRSP